MLAVVAAVSSQVGGEYARWSWLPLALVSAVAITFAVVVDRGGLDSARWWRTVAFYAAILEVVMGPAGALALMMGVDRDAPSWMIGFAFMSALVVPLVAMIVAHNASRMLQPPTTGEWGETDVDAVFDLRYRGHPAGHRPNSKHKSLEQILSMTISTESISLAVGSTAGLVTVALPDSGTYTRIPLGEVLDTRPVTVGREVLSAPWMILRSGTPIWASPGEAVWIRAQGGEFVIPIDNSTVVAELIQRRVRRASQRGTIAHTL
ncbi:hypothetical protein [Rhodococcus sp. NPDC058521]|uniref:hypothetical protein n=1 Tax=Rhodococcus sp. NPDC058521 TaxID=3346536 RepID=UPI00366946D9